MDDERALTLRQVAERCQLSYNTVFTMGTIDKDCGTSRHICADGVRAVPRASFRLAAMRL